MKILLSGGLGSIGGRFIEKFSNVYDIIAYVRDDSVENVKKISDIRNICIEKGSITNEKITSNIIKKHQPDVVIHLAAISGLTNCEEKTDDAFRVNVYGTHNIIKGCVENGSKLLFFSSREVYGKTVLDQSYESDPLLPNNIYGITKMLGENLVILANQKHNLGYTILRLTNVYGPGHDKGVNKMIRTALNENKIRIYGHDRIVNFLYIDDVVDMLHFILNDNRVSNQILNVGSPHSITLKEFAEKIASIINNKVQYELHPGKEIESDFNPSLRKLHSLGYFLNTALDAGIERTIDWYNHLSKNI